MRRIVIAGLTSGVGKTTITCALLAAFARRGKRVQPFKVGPDYIDPSHHTAVAGRPSRNLDSVLLPPDELRVSFARGAADADLSVVEGVMGLFDGRKTDGAGSTAEVGRLIESPVVVVLDVSHTAQTAAAMALGCITLDPSLAVAGFILNRVASESHAHTVTEAVERATGRPVFGAFPREPSLAMPERYLGLIPTSEASLSRELVDRLAAAAEAHLSLDRLWNVADAPALSAPPESAPGIPRARATIALARDRAFSFYYEDSLDVLRASGADLVEFSPLTDSALPPGTQGVYVGGGFPELFAEELADNAPMREALRATWRSGLPIYGECGGLMYLGNTLTDHDRRSWRMAGVVPYDSHLDAERVTVGYRTVTALRDTPLLPAESTTVGHEFHYSRLTEPVHEEDAAYRVAEGEDGPEGYARDNVLASYVHLHFATDRRMTARLVSTCAACKPLGQLSGV
jgi:cobyrinic acid a,c-diamide synthase